MSYGRKTAMDGLRKAGKFLGDIDQSYTEKVREVPMFDNMGSNVSFRETYQYPNQGENRTERAIVEAFTAGVAATNIASKYALPAGGVTLAGKGLLDMAARFGSPADEPEPNQLPLD